MNTSRLPAEVVSLVHYVELNKAGWWERVVQRLIIATIWLSEPTLTREDISQELLSNFSVSMDE